MINRNARIEAGRKAGLENQKKSSGKGNQKKAANEGTMVGGPVARVNKKKNKVLWEYRLEPLNKPTYQLGLRCLASLGSLDFSLGRLSGLTRMTDSLYSIKYADGDREDLDEAEYLFAFDLYQSNERSENYNDSASEDDGFTLNETDCEESPKPRRVIKHRTKVLANLTDVKRK
jgi:hypothetical protein